MCVEDSRLLAESIPGIGEQGPCPVLRDAGVQTNPEWKYFGDYYGFSIMLQQNHDLEGRVVLIICKNPNNRVNKATQTSAKKFNLRVKNEHFPA